MWTQSTDDYGRRTHHLHDASGRVVHAVVRLPKVAVEAGSLPYLSNDWTRPHEPGHVQYHATLARAKRWAESQH